MWRLIEGNLDSPQVIELLDHHLRSSLAESGSPDSCHALDGSALRAQDVRFWSLWEGAELLAIGALKCLDGAHGEIKSMHTVQSGRRRGAGSTVLQHLLATARTSGMRRLSLETGAAAYFAPARALYRRHGFVECPPFGDYRPDPNSVFMTRVLALGADG
ncbi:MAG TPA: GNAT family N-acetyltransferase [Steroidobacteraceae bacterium]|jgi:putative acetyltransferase|nr:GNAT family N-acetyltransferase [Steroidobacteraceae bacterium]